MCAEADRKRMVLSTIHVSQAHIFLEAVAMPGVGFVVIQTSRPFPVFYLAYGVTAGSENEFRARYDEQCNRLLLVWGGAC